MERTIAVGSWPGPGNEYVTLFCESLAAVEIRVKPVDMPWEALNKNIDLLHIHWPEQAYWTVGRLKGLVCSLAVLATLMVLRLRGVKLVWCVHNLQPHDASHSRLIFWNIYAGIISHMVHGFVTLSPSTVDIARNRFSGLKKKPAVFAWHPAYPMHAKSKQSSVWRKQHGIKSSVRVFAFIGHVRRYKGIIELLDAFCETSDLSLRLVIAGSIFEPELKSTIERIANRDKRIILDLRWLSESDLLETTLGADAIVLPFKRILHSGSIIYGLSCGKAVLTPVTPYANDLEKHVGGGWVQTYQPPLSAEVFSQFVQPHGSPSLDFLSTHTSGHKLKAFYQHLLSS